METSLSSNIEISEEIGRALIRHARIRQDDVDSGPYEIIAIEFDALSLAATAFGRIPNKPFNLDAIEILARGNARFVVAVVDEQLRICAMGARLDRENAVKLSDVIDENDGSLIPFEIIDGWCIFESK